MSSPLLKSAGWFLRPSHLKKPLEEELPDITPSTMSPVFHVEPLVPPVEEFFIRRCCPVTLSHLLPDLYLTQKQQIEESSSEFDANMKTKLEKHFEKSHSTVSCSNSSGNEEEDGEEEDELGDEKKLEESIENDINFHILHKGKVKFSNKQLLKPHVVNYPEPNMKESLLPGVTLNNKYYLSLKNQTIPPSLHSAKYIDKYSCDIADFQFSEAELQNIIVPFKNNRQIQPLLKNKEFSFSRSKKCKISLDREIKKQCNTFDRNNLSLFSRIRSNSRLFQDTSFGFTKNLPLTPPFHESKPSLCIHHRRAKSLPSFKMKLPMRASSPVLPETPDNLIMPSPHLLQLAKLKKEELQLKEKILVRQRQFIELERLKSPVEKWYEMKDYRFHQEVHKNNVFLRNENNLPLIRERRQQLYNVVMKSH